MRNKKYVCLLTILASTMVWAQKDNKPWKDWTKKEAEKIFNDSPWSRSQTETESSQSSDVPTNLGDTRGREEAARNVSTMPAVTFHVRLFTARPIRQAYVRILQLNKTPADSTAVEKMEAWANLPADDRIIVTVSFTGDERYTSKVRRTFESASVSTLTSNVYLERADGKRIPLSSYVPPAKDVFGARFVFPRALDGQPFLTPASGTIRFYAEYDPKNPEAMTQGGTRGNQSSARSESGYKLKLDLKFKVADMIHNGELEY